MNNCSLILVTTLYVFIHRISTETGTNYVSGDYRNKEKAPHGPWWQSVSSFIYLWIWQTITEWKLAENLQKWKTARKPSTSRRVDMLIEENVNRTDTCSEMHSECTIFGSDEIEFMY